MQTVEEMKAKQAADLAKLEAEHAIACKLPLPPKFAMLVSTGEKAWITYEAPDLWAALELMAKFDPIGFHKFKGTYTRYEPEAVNAARKKDKGESDGLALVAKFDTSGGEGHGPNVSLCFFAYVGDDICKIKIDLRPEGYGPASWGQYGPRFQRNGRGQSRVLDGSRYIAGDFTPNPTLSGMTDAYTKWGSGSREAWQYTYALCADYVAADYSATWTDARLRLENIANAMHGPRKLYRYDFDSQSMTGIIVRLADDLTSLRFTGDEAWQLRNGNYQALADAAESCEFS